MIVQATLDAIVVLANSFLTVLTISASIYWIHMQRRIRYLEGRLWLRQIGMENYK